MRRAAEIAAFLGLSAAVHAGVMSGLGTSSGGPDGQGAQGADRISLQAAPESLAALATRWTTPPDPMTSAASMAQPVVSENAVELPMDSTPQRLPAMPPLPQQTPAETPPVERTPAPAPPRPAMPVVPIAPAMPIPETPPAAPDHVDLAPPRNGSPPLTTPETPSNPAPDTAAPAPPGSTELATATSPRPPVRPFAPPPAQVAPTASPPSTPQPARVAAGAGNGAAQGASPAPTQAPATLSAADRQSLMAQWGGQIMARIERARPRVRASGQVVLALQVSRSGQLAGLSVARSSGDPALDEAAMTAVRRAGSFPAAPAGLTETSYGFSLPIRFR
ncbi:energy transducer TonB family protein [Roseicyclus mahoneyensis]|uniref:Protein TonB n=1 Tax=Roseicyclus mahoneyensis TaxID=164332 RepID=A0A316H2N9_9RHOB|nr:energy transducer TonB [Roseicyclus mahoneyensis]PWK61631.1 protein TonB [Roseicyclus mahoneyensis]